MWRARDLKIMVLLVTMIITMSDDREYPRVTIKTVTVTMTMMMMMTMTMTKMKMMMIVSNDNDKNNDNYRRTLTMLNETYTTLISRYIFHIKA